MAAQLQPFVRTSLLLLLIIPPVVSSPDEEKLYHDIFTERKYHKISRPVALGSDVVDVKLTAIVAKIIEINEQKEQLTASMEFYISWFDYRLKWNPADYGNLEALQVPASKLWLPTILLANNARENGGRLGLDDDLVGNVVKVKHKGECSWFVATISTTNCPVNVRYFPFDKQTCSLNFEQFQPLNEVHMFFNNKSKIPGQDYLDDGMWTLTDTSFNESIGYKFYNRIRINLYLSRKSFYYVVNFVIPCFAFSIISLVTFLIRPDSGERMGVSISLLLGIIVYQMIINDKLPETSDSVPLLGIYIEFIMVTFIISSIMFIIVMYLHSKEPSIPSWLRRFLTYYLVRMMCVRQHSALVATGSELSNGNEKSQGDASIEMGAAYDETREKTHVTMSRGVSLPAYQDFTAVSLPQSSTVSSPVQEDLLRDILSVLKKIDSKFDVTGQQIAAANGDGEKLETPMSQDWLLAAQAVDRLFFCICCAMCIFSNLFFAITWLVI